MLASLDRSTGLSAELQELYGMVVHFLLRGETTLVTLVYYNPAGLDCSWGILWQRNLTAHPQIVWQRSSSYLNLYDRLNSPLLVLACLPMDSSAAMQLETLANSLKHLRTVVRLLIEVAGPDQESLARQYLSYCVRQSMLHVELYFRNYRPSLILYTFQAFPSFELVKRRISGGQAVQLFTHKLDNLRGHRLRVMPDLSPPNTFFYRDARGDDQITGYLWDFLATFAGSVNAGLEVVRPSWRAGSASDSSYMLEYSAKGFIDVGLTTTLITKRNLWGIHQYSYPLLISNWCTMLPVEQPLPTSDLFGRIVCPALAILLLLIILAARLLFTHLSCLTRLQNSRPARIVPHLLALLLLTTCSAQLLSLLIYPPYQDRIASFEDLLRGDRKILGIRSEFYDMDEAFRARYAGIFHLIDDPNELIDLRNHFNTTWAYTMPYLKWMVIKIQQRHFSKPVFRWSWDLCFCEFMPTSVVMAPDSIYWEPLKDFTFSVHQAGLMDHWIRKSFYDMVKAGKMSIKDYSKLEILKPLKLGDLEIVWWLSGAFIAVASAVFLMELVYFYINVFLNGL
ncbi:uncharacterized protein LOC6526188 [Drosophila yakuba]|uniref:Ionotropic glutamate receptor C-terminal domain-containing protein n=1 Tax=Drosophila yakuba TaxID=7245 RepID=B4PZ44_DROYA|nr:uncharacterized protein LOC6526188 [Drosophila yakuba]EDX03105.1 uncharacterized protein Dyak_GE15295 [Drosophila yakuba]